jgi:hypothetical protein
LTCRVLAACVHAAAVVATGLARRTAATAAAFDAYAFFTHGPVVAHHVVAKIPAEPNLAHLLLRTHDAVARSNAFTSATNFAGRTFDTYTIRVDAMAVVADQDTVAAKFPAAAGGDAGAAVADITDRTRVAIVHQSVAVIVDIVTCFAILIGSDYRSTFGRRAICRTVGPSWTADAC